MPKAFFTDLTRCTACRGCQIACKRWNDLPATETKNFGSHQNPADLSAHTWRLVRFSETKENGKPKWLFFTEQCRHCAFPPCLETAEDYVEGAIIQDEDTGAILFTEKTAQLNDEEKEEVRESCPYDIPRTDEKTGIMAKCNWCIDRIKNGLKPACATSCPTECLNFGDREDMEKLAEKRLAEVKKRYPKAKLVDMDYTNVIYLVAEEPDSYYEYLEASLTLPGMSRRKMLAKIFGPVKNVQS